MINKIFGSLVSFALTSIVYAFSIVVFRSMIGYDIMEKRNHNTLKYYRMQDVGFWRWLLLKDYKHFAIRWHYILYIIHFFVGAAAVALLTISAMLNNDNRVISILCGFIYTIVSLLVAVPLFNRYFQRMRNPMKPYGKNNKR